MSITKKFTFFRNEIPEEVCLVAVSKTKPFEDLELAYSSGSRHFGENKAQEMCEKAAALPKDIYWHFIGHLQSNKVKQMASFVHLIHAVDSLNLLKEINKQAQKNNRVIQCLLQFHIAQEETKFGFSFEEAEQLLQDKSFVEMQNISIVGIMGMASFVENKDQIRDEFRTLHAYFQILKSNYFTFNPDFKEISMGMSGDYEIAIEEGSTMVRLGSSIFGSR